MSLSTRIALGVALVISLMVAVLGVTMVETTRATLTKEIDDRLISAAQRAQKMLPAPWEEIADARRGTVPANGAVPGEPTNDVAPFPGIESRDDNTIIVSPPLDDDQSSRDRDGGQVRRGHDEDVFWHEIAPRDMALIVVGAGGKKVALIQGSLESPPALPAIPGLVSTSDMGKPINLLAVDGSMTYRAVVLPGPRGEAIIAAESLQPVDQVVFEEWRKVIVAGVLAVVIASLISWWVIRRGLRPVDRMVETAAAIADGDLSRRVPDADPETELGRLGTALNEMLGQIEAGIKEREAAEAKLRRFVADAAHELRTPLTSLRGYAELYRQGALPTTDAVGNAMGRIESEGARMARLVDDLLLLARTDQGRALEKEPVDLVRLAREAAGDFAAADPTRPLTRNLEGTAVVIGDPIRLRQAIDNLLTNVRTHTPPDTPTRVSVQRTGSWVEVTVADDGPGIPTTDQGRIFERFWRGDPSRGRKSGGAGLGLSIVDSLVRAHGGTVAVKSSPGHGTAFTLRLPLASRETEDGGRRTQARSGDSQAASRELRAVSKATP